MAGHVSGIDAANLLADLGLSVFSLLALAFLALAFSSYIKIVTVLAIVRVGMGFRSVPSAFVTGSLALSLAFFVMYPTLISSSEKMDSYLKSKHGASDDKARAAAVNIGIEEWRKFLLKHSNKEESARFATIAQKFDQQSQNAEKEKAAADVTAVETDLLTKSWRVLAPSFLVSELKEAFSTGLALFLPFLVIDLLVINIMTALTIDRLNPALVSFPFKILLFVLADGWSLITTNLVSSYLS